MLSPCRKVWCAIPRGESGVPPLERGPGVPSPGGEGLVCPLQEGRVWCALSRRGGSGVPSAPNVVTPHRACTAKGQVIANGVQIYSM